MILDDVIELIKEDIAPDAVGDAIAEETAREVFVGVKSIGAKRKIEAEQMGLKLAYTFVLSDPGDYEGEQILSYRGTRYNIVSDYLNDNFELELTAARF